AAMVKIAAKLITNVATVIPERSGFRRKLSDASRASTQDELDRRKAHRQNHRTPDSITRGQRNARPSKKTNIPTTPTLNCCTGPGRRSGRKTIRGETTKQKRPRRVAQDFFLRNEGLQALCLAFSRGLTRIASNAGCSAARTATTKPLARDRPSSRKVKIPGAKSTSEKRFATVSPTATSASCASSHPNTLPAKEPINARMRASRTIKHRSSPRFIPRHRRVPISRFRWITETDTVL